MEATEIPEDVRRSAHALWDNCGFDGDERAEEMTNVQQTAVRLMTKYLVIEAILAERERCAAIVSGYDTHGLGKLNRQLPVRLMVAAIRKGA